MYHVSKFTALHSIRVLATDDVDNFTFHLLCGRAGQQLDHLHLHGAALNAPST